MFLFFYEHLPYYSTARPRACPVLLQALPAYKLCSLSSTYTLSTAELAVALHRPISKLSSLFLACITYIEFYHDKQIELRLKLNPVFETFKTQSNHRILEQRTQGLILDVTKLVFPTPRIPLYISNKSSCSFT
jgi:hypothetical protein